MKTALFIQLMLFPEYRQKSLHDNRVPLSARNEKYGMSTGGAGRQSLKLNSSLTLLFFQMCAICGINFLPAPLPCQAGWL